MKNDGLFARLEDYLEGKLSEAERSELEARLAADPDLAEDLKLLRELRDLTTSEEADLSLNTKLDAIASPYFGNKSESIKKHQFNWQRLAIAASVLLLVVAGWYFFTGRPTAEEQLLANYFQPPSDFGTYRSGGTEMPNSLAGRVDSLYRLGLYGEALALMEKAQTSLDGLPASGFYYQLGVLYLLNEQPDRAIGAFNKVQNGHSNDKNWYLAWAYFKKGDKTAAKSAFETIARSESPYRSLAAEILNELE